MTGLIGRITVGNICPRSTRAQYPQNPIQDGTPILPWTTPTDTEWRWLRNEAIEDLPLCVGEVSDANTPHSFVQKYVFYLASHMEMKCQVEIVLVAGIFPWHEHEPRSRRADSLIFAPQNVNARVGSDENGI
jgi:hypothetical protein